MSGILPGTPPRAHFSVGARSVPQTRVCPLPRPRQTPPGPRLAGPARALPERGASLEAWWCPGSHRRRLGPCPELHGAGTSSPSPHGLSRSRVTNTSASCVLWPRTWTCTHGSYQQAFHSVFVVVHIWAAASTFDPMGLNTLRCVTRWVTAQWSDDPKRQPRGKISAALLRGDRAGSQTSRGRSRCVHVNGVCTVCACVWTWVYVCTCAQTCVCVCMSVCLCAFPGHADVLGDWR